jgi:hypothetical protein
VAASMACLLAKPPLTGVSSLARGEGKDIVDLKRIFQACSIVEPEWHPLAGHRAGPAAAKRVKPVAPRVAALVCSSCRSRVSPSAQVCCYLATL